MVYGLEWDVLWCSVLILVGTRTGTDGTDRSYRMWHHQHHNDDTPTKLDPVYLASVCRSTHRSSRRPPIQEQSRGRLVLLSPAANWSNSPRRPPSSDGANRKRQNKWMVTMMMILMRMMTFSLAHEDWLPVHVPIVCPKVYPAKASWASVYNSGPGRGVGLGYWISNHIRHISENFDNLKTVINNSTQLPQLSGVQCCKASPKLGSKKKTLKWCLLPTPWIKGDPAGLGSGNAPRRSASAAFVFSHSAMTLFLDACHLHPTTATATKRGPVLSVQTSNKAPLNFCLWYYGK